MITQEEAVKRIESKYKGQYTLIGEYAGKRKKVLLHCHKHDCDFEISGETALRQDRINFSCPECKKVRSGKYNRIQVTCAYCGVLFEKTPSKMANSKSGLHFCCREHKDLGQRLECGLEELWPSHYNTGISSYRDKALRAFEHKCCVCGYNEETSILEVHHKDSNRSHNELDNLCILCPNCHRKITLKLYILTSDYKLVKV